MMTNDLPPWYTMYQQAQRWQRAGVFEALVHDLRRLLRELAGRAQHPSAAILDGRTPQSTSESGDRAGCDGHKRRKGSKVHMAVDTLGHLLAILVTPVNEQERAQVGELAEPIQEVIEDSVEIAFVDQGYTGEQPAAAAAEHGIRLEVVKLPSAKRGFVLLPQRWVVERSFGWMARFRRLVRGYERLDETIIGMHFTAFAILMAQRFVALMAESS
jgi:transposase